MKIKTREKISSIRDIPFLILYKKPCVPKGSQGLKY
jgi:hypothetical protein